MTEFFKKIIAIMLSFFTMLGINASFGTFRGDEVESEDYTYTVYDNKLGADSIELSFVANPSTGYGWEIKQSGNSIKQTSDTYKQKPGTEGLCGAPCTEIFEYTAQSEGKTTLLFTYCRSWELCLAAKEIKVTITVDSDLNITVDDFVVKQA